MKDLQTHNTIHNIKKPFSLEGYDEEVDSRSVFVSRSLRSGFQYAALPETVRIGTDTTYAPFSRKMPKVTLLALISISVTRCETDAGEMYLGCQ